jgi:hypothetical protein
LASTELPQPEIVMRTFLTALLRALASAAA